MENNINMSQIVINTINTILQNLISSIDERLYDILDDLTFINSNIMQDKYFEKIFGTSASNGILLIANSLLIAYILYFAVKYLSSNLTLNKIENPVQFILKLVIFGIAMNSSYFIVTQILEINSNISLAIKSIGEDLFGQNISFSNLLKSINFNLGFNEQNLDVFSVDGIIKGTTTFSLINLVTEYALRYVMVKIFILLSPFAILSLCMENTSWFFKLWIKNLFCMLIIQTVVSLILLVMFSIDYNSQDLMIKFIYVGGIHILIRANSFAREFLAGYGITTQVHGNMGVRFEK